MIYIYEIAQIYIEIYKEMGKEWNKYISNSELKSIKINKFKNDIYNGISHIPIEKYKKILTYESNILAVNDLWTEGMLISKDETDQWIDTLLLQVFYTHAVQRRMIQLHSSLISHQNQGIMFLGPSGIGKTTQAELWQKYRASLIINGDIVFVQEIESGFLGWGTPWHGSSPYCENTSVPLKAMVVLKQAEQNSIRELSGFEKVTEVSNSVFYPQWLENGMELCLETLDHLLISIPVYELRCRPDEDAVRLTEQTVF